MKTVLINGKFMADRMQGIVRYAKEICCSLDMIENGDVNWILVVPPNAKNIPVFKKIEVKKIGTHVGIVWEQLDFKYFARKNKHAICLNLCNVAPFGLKPGITTIHDIMYKVNPQDYTTLRNRISKIWHCIQYRYICKHERIILTDSVFSKTQIEKSYPFSIGKTEVVYCGWEHIKKYNENPDFEKKYPFISKGSYYFSLSTLSRNKNGKWIVEVAKKNPESNFVIAGKIYESDMVDIPKNVFLVGFISDEDACSFIKKCKAFIHPALYEGFGLPPLEALALGAKVIASNTTSLPEVLKNSVHYIDPYDYDVKIDNLINEPVDPPCVALNRFSWYMSAKRVQEIVEKL